MRKISAFICVLMLLAAIVFLPGCTTRLDENHLYAGDPESPYTSVLSDVMLGYTVIRADGNGLSLSPTRNKTKAITAFDVQAKSASEHGFYRYDHFKVTAVIAVDRSVCKRELKSWRDLEDAECPVGFAEYPDSRMLFAAVSHAFDESYLSDEAVSLFSSLARKGLFAFGKTDVPVSVCWDYQAVAMKKENENIEIIIPSDGTLTYSVGVVSEKPIDFPENMQQRLYSAGLRTEKQTPSFYPDEEEYKRAASVDDVQKFARETNNYTAILKRKIMRTRLYSAADSFEHKLLSIAVVIITILWMGHSMRSVQRHDIKCIFAAMGAMVIAWMLVTALKYQSDAFPALGRYCWYSYYIFMMGLPLLMLLLSAVIDTPENTRPPKYMMYSCVSVYAALLVLVFTNDLHEWVFEFDASGGYKYCFGYYIIFVFVAFCILLSTVTLIKKALRGFGRAGLVLPIVLELLLLSYCVAYITDVPSVRDGDMTLVSCVFSLIFAGVAMKTGLIPVNTKYDLLFSSSPLKMQILDSSGEVSLCSAGAAPISQKIKSAVLKNTDNPLLQSPDVLLFADDIPGGTVVWQENISEILKMQQEIKESIEKLEAANKLLLTERENKYRLAAAEEKVRLMDMLGDEIQSHLERMKKMIRLLEKSEDKQKDIAKITLLLCYVKRRCNLFFKEQEGGELPVEELAVYIDELSEFAAYADVRVATVCTASGSVSPRRGTVLYDFFYRMLDICSNRESTILEQLVDVENGIEMKLLPSFFDFDASFLEDALDKALDLVGGKITIKELDETAGLSLFVPKGETEK